jgi:hypothetical protein
LVRHRDRLRQDVDDRVRPLHRLADLAFPEFTRQIRTLDSQLATCLRAEYPTARATPRPVIKRRYDGPHFVGPELARSLVEAAKRSVGQHHGPASKLQARHMCQDLDIWRKRIAEIEHDTKNLRDTHVKGKLITSIGPQTGTRAGIGPLGKARQRRVLWMPVLSAVKRDPWLRAFHLRIRAAGKPAKVAMIAAMRKLLHAVCSVAKHRRPFTTTEQGRAGEPPNSAIARPGGA